MNFISYKYHQAQKFGSSGYIVDFFHYIPKRAKFF